MCSVCAACGRSDGMKRMWAFPSVFLGDPESLPVVERMCKRHPKTRVVIDHFARIGMKGLIRQTDIEKRRRLEDFRNTFVKTSAV